MITIDSILADVLKNEGGYVNDPKDAGGETNWGITIATARSQGYKGAMKDLPKATALEIYRGQYVVAPGFGMVANVSAVIAAELVDTGVNMGPRVAGEFLQRALNALSDNGRDYAKLLVDGVVGNASITALKAFKAKRGALGEARLLAALNALQGERYITLTEGRSANAAFLFGWLGRIV